MDELTTKVSVRAYGVNLSFQTNDATWLPRVAAFSYPPTWQFIPLTSRIDRTFSLQTRPSRFTLYEEDEQAISTRSRRVVLEDLERRMKIFVAEMSPRRVFVHAGVVGWRGRAIVLPGKSYSGKTSLVTALLKAGATYYSDEYAVFDLQGRVHAYPQPLAIRKGDGSVRQFNTPASEFGAAVGSKPLTLGAIILSQYESGARWRPQPLTTGQAVLGTLENTVPARRKPAVVFPTLSKAIAHAPAWRLKRNEADDAAALLLSLLSSSW